MYYHETFALDDRDVDYSNIKISNKEVVMSIQITDTNPGVITELDVHEVDLVEVMRMHEMAAYAVENNFSEEIRILSHNLDRIEVRLSRMRLNEGKYTLMLRGRHGGCEIKFSKGSYPSEQKVSLSGAPSVVLYSFEQLMRITDSKEKRKELLRRLY